MSALSSVVSMLPTSMDIGTPLIEIGSMANCTASMVMVRSASLPGTTVKETCFLLPTLATMPFAASIDSQFFSSNAAVIESA